ncbi:acyl-CoA carboxylase subunit epsilon [Streptomyces sp. NRRL F-2747]|uniref:acyl-CoA carboxylase subunit epsilon n=1 Tax=unclassified Streptomyces TaxID=2593676 RepID=UPI0004CB6FD8|nr:acyl-CoA carboxylase subunit epsilon [Streptomyces sp. NRRL F-2747]
MTNTADTLLRVEKGNAAPEELAAITAILLARAASAPEGPTVHRIGSQARWRRLERTPGFRAPHSWQG